MHNRKNISSQPAAKPQDHGKKDRTPEPGSFKKIHTFLSEVLPFTPAISSSSTPLRDLIDSFQQSRVSSCGTAIHDRAKIIVRYYRGKQCCGNDFSNC
jgi:hypothetical protein